MMRSHRIYIPMWAIIIFTLVGLLCLDIRISIGIIIVACLMMEPIKITCVAFGCVLYLAYLLSNDMMGLSIFMVNSVIYHMGEFLHVCYFKYDLISWDSFLINHSIAYNVAVLFAIAEYLIEWQFITKMSWIIYIGVLMSSVGHILRIGAFITAGVSFHHRVQMRKANDHTLITHGIYSISRHPSYLGFFIYSLGQQVILHNPIAFLLYIPVLYKFFIGRIVFEEYYLIEFFGQQYIDYKNVTPIGIPFIESFIN